MRHGPPNELNLGLLFEILFIQRDLVGREPAAYARQQFKEDACLAAASSHDPIGEPTVVNRKSAIDIANREVDGIIVNAHGCDFAVRNAVPMFPIIGDDAKTIGAKRKAALGGLS